MRQNGGAAFPRRSTMFAEGPINERVTALVSAWNRGDLRAFVDAFTYDAEYITGDGEWVRGQDAIEHRFRREFRRPTLFHIDETSVRVISETAAVAHLVWSSPERRGIVTAVFAAPEWKIVSLQNTDAK
jgi:uncharacterized protein (TIGR02246 family)